MNFNVLAGPERKLRRKRGFLGKLVRWVTSLTGVITVGFLVFKYRDQIKEQMDSGALAGVTQKIKGLLGQS